MPVHVLKDAIGSYAAERILIKLDIEGMEVEALSAFLPTEERPVHVVGELHKCSVNAPQLERLFGEHGWSYEIGQITDDITHFQACSPAALSFLASMASVKRAFSDVRAIEMA